MSKKILPKVSLLILDTLKSSKSPLSTYDIAKKVGISWSTANIHCYRLQVLGYLKSREEEPKIGVKRVVWWLK